MNTQRTLQGAEVEWHEIESIKDMPYIGRRVLFRHRNGFIFYARVVARGKVKSLNPGMKGRVLDWYTLAAWGDDLSVDKEAEQIRLERAYAAAD
jgi:hypothetical protein